MKNTKANQEKWLNKIYETLMIGGKSKKTFDNYKSHIIRFLNYYPENQIIKNLDESDILEYLKNNYLNLNKTSNTLNVAECSIRFLFSICFDKELNRKKLPTCKTRKRLPVIVTKENFITIFNNEKNLKYKCWLILAFASGLRVEEVANIQVEDINSKEHKIKVLGKGNKERYTILPDCTIRILRIYCKQNHINSGYIFKGKANHKVMNSKTIINYFSLIKENYNLSNNITFHSLRHSFATYYLANGGSLLALQSMLGHTHLNTTTIYLHLSQNFNELEGIKYV
jgi:site-specific recombinase XerD